MSTLSRLAARVAVAIALAGLMAAGRAAAQGVEPGASRPAAIAAQGDCPDAAAVWAALGTLVPRDRFAAHLARLAGAGPAIEIADLGASYRVVAAGRSRVYRDDARLCDERARVAALFIALAVDPMDTSPTDTSPADTSAAEPSPASTSHAGASAPLPTPPAAGSVDLSRRAGPVGAPVMAAPPQASSPEPPPLLDLQVGPALDVGLGSGGSALVAPAAVVGLAVGRGWLAALVQLTADLPVDTSVGAARLRQWRAPLTLGVRARMTGARAVPYAELGLAAGPIVARGRDIVSPATAASLEVGLLAAVGIRLGGRTGGFVVARAEIVPDPPEVFAPPAGDAGHTPRLWLGAAAGLSLGVR